MNMAAPGRRGSPSLAFLIAMTAPACLQAVAALIYVLVEHSQGYRPELVATFAAIALLLSPLASFGVVTLLAPGLNAQDRLRLAAVATILGVFVCVVLIAVAWYLSPPTP